MNLDSGAFEKLPDEMDRIADKSWARSPSKKEGRAGAMAELHKAQSAWKLLPKPAPKSLGCAYPLSADEFSNLEKELKSAQAIGLFVPFAKWREASDLEGTLVEFLGAQVGKSFAYPRLEKDNANMEFARCRLADTSLENGSWPSAPKSAPTVTPDWIIAPALALDSWGQRLGRGAGHYDRFFAQNPGVRRVGCVHSDFVVEQFPASWIEDHDVTVELVWTDKGLYKTPALRPQTEQLFAFKEKRK